MTPWVVYVVNLRGDNERWETVKASIGHLDWIRLLRIEAVYGSGLPDDVCIRLTGDRYSVIAKGAIGCALSHVRAWEMISKGEEPWVLIIEDDAVIENIAALKSVVLPDELDFAFCNHRTQPNTSLAPSEARSGQPDYISVERCLLSIEARRRAVGTDGYFISRAGANKLVNLFKQHGYFGHVDIRMMAYALDGHEMNQILPETSWLRQGVSQIQRVTGTLKSVTASVFSPALTTHDALKETSRTREDRLGTIGGNPPVP